MNKEILPIGSIVTVEGQDVMICAYIKPGTKIKDKLYDYACCLYPAGMSENTILIKKEQIQRVKFIGFQDSRFVNFKKELEKIDE